MGTDSAATTVLAALWVALMLQCLSLYFIYTEPFDGTWRAYTMRLLSPVTIVLLALAIVQRKHGRRR